MPPLHAKAVAKRTPRPHQQMGSIRSPRLHQEAPKHAHPHDAGRCHPSNRCDNQKPYRYHDPHMPDREVSKSLPVKHRPCGTCYVIGTTFSTRVPVHICVRYSFRPQVQNSMTIQCRHFVAIRPLRPDFRSQNVFGLHLFNQLTYHSVLERGLGYAMPRAKVNNCLMMMGKEPSAADHLDSVRFHLKFYGSQECVTDEMSHPAIETIGLRLIIYVCVTDESLTVSLSCVGISQP